MCLATSLLYRGCNVKQIAGRDLIAVDGCSESVRELKRGGDYVLTSARFLARVMIELCIDLDGEVARLLIFSTSGEETGARAIHSCAGTSPERNLIVRTTLMD